MAQIYVVSVYSNYTGELESEIVHANSLMEAFENCKLTQDWINDWTPKALPEGNDKHNLENLKQYMFDNDHAINIIRID